MKITQIAGTEYEVRECWCDKGLAHDATNADKVATGGQTVTSCSHCRGKGETYHLILPAEAKAVLIDNEPIGEIPDWML